jgi:hypothetical protein
LDPSKTGKGILARLEHKAAEPPRHIADSTPSGGRGAALVVSAGTLIGALLAWWLYSGPSPVIVQETLPQFAQAAPPQPEPAPVAETAAAAIVDVALPPVIVPHIAASPGLAAVLEQAPTTAATMRRERVAVTRPKAEPKTKRKPGAKQLAATRGHAHRATRTSADTDVALLSALVAHANERDVVEPGNGDSTASLLQRCQRVGGEEGRLCKLRICSTRMEDGCHSN